MYSGNYPFGNAAPPFNNGNPQQPGMPPTQQMMYNQQQQQQQQQQQAQQQQAQQQQAQQQQFPGMAPQGGFPGGNNPQMMPGSHPGMMQQNPNLPNMAANSQMAGFQQQFPGSPYGQQVLQSTAAPQTFPPGNFMMAGGMQGFPMNQAGMAQQQQQQQQMMQRMQQQQAQQAQQQQQHQQQQQQQHQQQLQQHQQQQPQQMQQQPQQTQQVNQAMSQASTPQRPPSAPQGTPNQQVPPQHAQFSTPQALPQGPTPGSQQQPPIGQKTPQTPTFAQNQGPGMSQGQLGPPASPTTVNRDRERFAILLDINHELLYESIQIQKTQQLLRKDNATEGNSAEKKPSPEEALFLQDYLQCMKRLQANLTYMAAVADRKPEVKVPAAPVYLTAPTLNHTLRLRSKPVGLDGNERDVDQSVDREQRDQDIKELYAKLQAAYPNIDPNKEPALRASGAQQRPGNLSQASPIHHPPQMPQANYVGP